MTSLSSLPTLSTSMTAPSSKPRAELSADPRFEPPRARDPAPRAPTEDPTATYAVRPRTPDVARDVRARVRADEDARRRRVEGPSTPPPAAYDEVEPAELAEKSEALAALEERAKRCSKRVDALTKTLAEKARKIDERQAKGSSKDVAKRTREHRALSTELDAARADHARAAEAAAAARRALSTSRLLVVEDRGPPRALEEYRGYLAEKLGVSRAQVSEAFARFAQAEELKVADRATAQLRRFLPEGALTSRADARGYFDSILKNVEGLVRSKRIEDERRRAWERTHHERWALDGLPPAAVLGGTGPDSPVVRWGTARSEKVLAPVVGDLVFRLRSTALNGRHTEHDGSERTLADVFDDARYAQALAHQAIRAVEDEARARFHEVLRTNRATIELGLDASERVDALKSGLERLWPSAKAAR